MWTPGIGGRISGYPLPDISRPSKLDSLGDGCSWLVVLCCGTFLLRVMNLLRGLEKGKKSGV